MSPSISLMNENHFENNLARSFVKYLQSLYPLYIRLFEPSLIDCTFWDFSSLPPLISTLLEMVSKRMEGGQMLVSNKPSEWEPTCHYETPPHMTDTHLRSPLK